MEGYGLYYGRKGNAEGAEEGDEARVHLVPASTGRYGDTHIIRGVRASDCNKSVIIWNVWKDVLFNALKVWKWGFAKSKKGLKSD